MKLVDCQGATDQAGSKNWGVDGDQLPHSGVVVGEDLELGVEVEVQIDEAREGGGRVTRRHGLEAVVDGVSIPGADLAGVVDLLEPSSIISSPNDAGIIGSKRDVRLAHGQEVRAQASDEPLDENLKDGGCDQGVQEADDGVVDVPERANADLHDEEHKDGDEGGEQRSGPDGDDLLSKRVGELGIDNLAVGESDGK